MEKSIEYKANQKLLRTQRVKTYFLTLLNSFLFLLVLLPLILCLLHKITISKLTKKSQAKLADRKESFKTIKKSSKLKLKSDIQQIKNGEQ